MWLAITLKCVCKGGEAGGGEGGKRTAFQVKREGVWV